MYLRNSVVRIAGLVMLLAIICTVITVVFSIIGSNEEDPFQRDEIAKFLTETADSKTELRVASGVGIIVDGFLGPLLAGLLYILFRDRSRLLATATLVGLLAGFVISAMTDGANVLLTVVAEDYVKGGVGGAQPLDQSALEVGRYLAMLTLISFQIVLTVSGLGLLALGLLIARAPEGAINPPRWLGWVALVSGLASELAWLVVAADPFFVFFPIQILTLAVFLIGTSYWLLTHGNLEPAQ